MRSLLVACVFVVGCGSANGESENLDPGGGLKVDAGGDGGGLNGGLDGAVGDGIGGADTSNRCGSTLTGVLRDFKEAHPDFEFEIGDDKGIVLADLGSDGKPVYAGSGGNPTTTSKENFDQWFRDVASVNKSVTFPITLAKTGAVFTFEDNDFFPLDGQGWGNEGHDHNFHFTYELRTTFNYAGGESFKFTGDDDLFVFINKKLAIDLGGVHGAQTGEVSLDGEAGKLGLTKGNVYSLDFFFAERHLTESHFRIDTTLNFVDCGSGIK